MTTSLNYTDTNTSDFIVLALWMAGDFSNQKQSFANLQDFVYVHIFSRSLAFDLFSGIGFYSEDGYDYDLLNLSSQGIDKQVIQDEYIYVENNNLKDPICYAGADRKLDILVTIIPECIERRFNCSIAFKCEGEIFLLSVEAGNQCLRKLNTQKNYLVSDSSVIKYTCVSLDKGMDIETHKQLWGSTHGALKFQKIASFASELLVASS